MKTSIQPLQNPFPLPLPSLRIAADAYRLDVREAPEVLLCHLFDHLPRPKRRRQLYKTWSLENVDTRPRADDGTVPVAPSGTDARKVGQLQRATSISSSPRCRTPSWNRTQHPEASACARGTPGTDTTDRSRGVGSASAATARLPTTSDAAAKTVATMTVPAEVFITSSTLRHGFATLPTLLGWCKQSHSGSRSPPPAMKSRAVSAVRCCTATGSARSSPRTVAPASGVRLGVGGSGSFE